MGVGLMTEHAWRLLAEFDWLDTERLARFMDEALRDLGLPDELFMRLKTVISGASAVKRLPASAEHPQVRIYLSEIYLPDRQYSAWGFFHIERVSGQNRHAVEVFLYPDFN